VVIVEHDMDGDPSTRGDLLQTIYEHVDPLVAIGDIVSQGQVIARTSIVRGQHLHFGIRRAAFDSTDPDVYRTILPPPETSGCTPCFGRPLPVPAFPERWEDPAQLFRTPADFAVLLDGGEEGGGDVLETPDGYVVAGWTRAANIGGTGSSDMWLVRLDDEGRILSQRAYGSPATEEIRRLVPVSDGGFVALARSVSTSNRISPMLVKFNAAADHIEWQTLYTASGVDWGNDVRATSDGGFVIAGATDPCACGGQYRATVVKLDAGGAVQWAKSYQSFAFAQIRSTDAASIVETAQGGFVGIGMVTPGPFGAGSDLLVFRLDSTGHPIWSTVIPGPLADFPGQVEPTSDGGFVVVGTRYHTTGQRGLWFLKIRSDGSIERQATYIANGRLAGIRMVPMPDSGYVLAGHIHFPEQDRPDLLIMKLDATGQVVLQRAFDGRGASDDVTGLRPTRDGGFILTGGHDLGCSRCVPGWVPPSHLIVVKTNADLEVTPGCGPEIESVRLSGASSVGQTQAALVEETLILAASPGTLTPAETGARAYACDEGSYGPPPVFQSASVQSAESSAACDFTHLIEAALCTFGVPGVEATMPVILSGTYDEIEIDARVTDEDSTPERSDIAQVLASIAQPGESFLIPVPLLDDGSAQVVLENQKSNSFGEDCFNDPIHGVCSCFPARYPTSSGDFVIGDSVYTHRDALINLNQSPLLADCVMSSRHRTTRWFPASTSLDVSLQATDRLGNTSAWPVPIQVTTGINSLACSGDACGCCLLLAFDRQTGVEQCAGLDGMRSPQFPCGLCVGIFAGSCPP
jgi:hypothetical protein